MIGFRGENTYEAINAICERLPWFGKPCNWLRAFAKADNGL